jgi:hypothetical protein
VGTLCGCMDGWNVCDARSKVHSNDASLTEGRLQRRIDHGEGATGLAAWLSSR